MPDWPHLPAPAALAVALVPGLLAALWGREVLERAAEPGTPERLLAYRVRLQRALATAVAVLAVAATSHAPWAVLIALFSTRAGAFGIRRKVFEDSWSFGAYMLHGARVTLLLMGFWVALASGPWIVLALPLPPRAAALLFGALLLAWSSAMPRLARFAFRARPLEDPGTLARLARVTERSTAKDPEILRGGPPGARWANALALPSLARPGVLLSDDLLRELAPEEVDAIYAHEVAHLEHHDRKRLLGGQTAVWLAIGLSCLLGLAMAGEGARMRAPFAAAAYGLAVLVGLVVIARRRQAHEAASDRRAVELCGDAEALIRALVRIHALGKVPRRWSAELESRATHPSLARRIRALKALASVLPEVPAEAVYASAAPGRWLAFAPDRLHVLEGVPGETAPELEALLSRASAARSLRYEALAELRLAAARGGLSLVGRESGGRTFAVPVKPEDVARLQVSLDAVDGLLSAAPPVPARPRLRVRVVSAIALVASFLPAAIGTVAVPAVLSLLFPSRAALASLGAASLAAAGLVLRRAVAWAPWLTPALALIGLLVAALALLLFVREPPEDRPRAAGVLGWVLALSILLAAAPLLLAFDREHAAVGLHLAARAHPGLVVLLVAAAGALLGSTGRSGRLARRLLAAAALAPLLLGSRLFLAGADDPLAFTGREAAVVERATYLVKRDPIDFDGRNLRLSPDASRWALERIDGEGRWVVGDFSSGRQELPGSELRFLDARRVLVVDEPDEDGAPELRLYELPDVARPAWRRALPRIDSVRLDVDGVRYRATGIDLKTRELVRVAGEAGGTDAKETRWAGPKVLKAVPLASWAVGDGEDAVDLERTLAPRSSVSTAVKDIVPWHSEIWALRGKSPRRLASTSLTIRCLPELSPDATCLTVTPEETYLWSVDARAGSLAPLVSVSGRAREEASLSGGRLALWMGGARLLVVNPRTRGAELLKLPAERAWGVSLAPSKELLGILVQGGDGRAVLALGH